MAVSMAILTIPQANTTICMHRHITVPQNILYVHKVTICFFAMKHAGIMKYFVSIDVSDHWKIRNSAVLVDFVLTWNLPV